MLADLAAILVDSHAHLRVTALRIVTDTANADTTTLTL